MYLYAFREWEIGGRYRDSRALAPERKKGGKGGGGSSSSSRRRRKYTHPSSSAKPVACCIGFFFCRAQLCRRSRSVVPQRSRIVACNAEPSTSQARDATEGYILKLGALQRYIVSIPRHGVVGSSLYAKKLRRRVREEQRRKDFYCPPEVDFLRKNRENEEGAAPKGKDKEEGEEMLCIGPSRRPVMVFGEPGLEKDNIAALIHFGSPRRRFPMFQVRSKMESKHAFKTLLVKAMIACQSARAIAVDRNYMRVRTCGLA